MDANYNKPTFKKLLEKLQEESWQLELLISGFAIFGLFYAIEPIKNMGQEAQFNGEWQSSIFYIVIYLMCLILIFNLLLHVLLRGLWIGALGLRYVSGEIDYDQLNYTPKFSKYLKRKVGPFDRYIGKLENYCSIIFAISFLLIFYVLAVTIVMLLLSAITYLLNNEAYPVWISKGIGIPLLIIMVIGMLLTFFDFVTQGLLKKKIWVAKIYFPFYLLFSFLTLSFLYRPLVYNFLDNKFGKRVSYILLPFYIGIMVLTSFKYQKSNYLKVNNIDNVKSNKNVANNRSYEDLILKNDLFMDGFAIQSKVITQPYLKLIFSFSKKVEDRIIEFNPSLEPKKDKRGLQSGMHFGSLKLNKTKQDSLRNVYLKTFNKIYNIKIDSSYYEVDFVITKKKDNKFGFESYLKINDLSEGKHVVDFVRLKNKNTDSLLSMRKIPFWYFKE